jgi:hypothetical protein
LEEPRERLQQGEKEEGWMEEAGKLLLIPLINSDPAQSNQQDVLNDGPFLSEVPHDDPSIGDSGFRRT